MDVRSFEAMPASDQSDYLNQCLAAVDENPHDIKLNEGTKALIKTWNGDVWAEKRDSVPPKAIVR